VECHLTLAQAIMDQSSSDKPAKAALKMVTILVTAEPTIHK
jgi:hypothetical protein